MSSSCQPYNGVISMLISKYGLTDSQAVKVYDLGDSTNQEAEFNGHKFWSGHQTSYDDEYYIPVFGDNGLLFSRYHYEG